MLTLVFGEELQMLICFIPPKSLDAFLVKIYFSDILQLVVVLVNFVDKVLLEQKLVRLEQVAEETLKHFPVDVGLHNQMVSYLFEC